jgi:hypothetical protein
MEKANEVMQNVGLDPDPQRTPMIRIGKRIRLVPKEKAFLEGLVQQPVNPTTVEHYNAWIEEGLVGLCEDDPEERLFRRVIEAMRIKE